jgi:hypothetical protein
VAENAQIRLADGQLDWAYGVDSSRVTTIASPAVPNGLPRNALSWANNATMRGGGVGQRYGWQPVCKLGPASGLYQGGLMYEQTNDFPYLIFAISGRLYNCRLDIDNSINDITGSAVLPPTQPLYHFVQGETFVVVQAGDYVTLPAFFGDNGNVFRQSNGLNPTYFNFTGSHATNILTVPGHNLQQGNQVRVAAPPYPGNLPCALQEAVTYFVLTVAGNNITLSATLNGPVLALGCDGEGSIGLIAELPAAGPMVYYQGRIWYAYYRSYTGGDIVNGPSGTAAFQLSDSILKVTENPLAIGGDGFAVPSQAGNIRAMEYSANLDVTLGQGTLFVFTSKQVYALDVPIDRASWIAAGANNTPLQRVVQRTNGGVSDRSVVAVNGDLFYQSLEPGIRSLFTALRYFNQWGNKPISSNLQRALQFNDRALMRWSSGIQWENRMYQTILPTQVPQGVIHQGIAVMDFEPLGSFQQDLPPNWEGMHEGLDVLQMFTGDFGGRERAFAVVVSRTDQSIWLWELTDSETTDGTDTLVNWYVETPAFTWGHEFDLKRLDGGEVWVDSLYGQAVMKFYYRTDANPCWQLWHAVPLCSARNCCEDVNAPVTYPLTIDGVNGKFPVILPVPPKAPCSAIDARPLNIGHQFQVKVAVQGYLRIRGIIVYAVPVLKTPFNGLQSLPAGLPATVP